MQPVSLETPPESSFANVAAASAAVDAERVEAVREFEESLDVDMTDADVVVMSDEVARISLEMTDAETQLANENRRHKDEKARLEGIISERSRAVAHRLQMVRTRSWPKLVKCRDEKVFATGIVRTVRLDTGEVIDERPMDKSERQADLFGSNGTKSEAPENFSRLADDESEPPPEPRVIKGEITSVNLENEGDSYDFTIALATFGTHIQVTARDAECSGLGFAVGHHVELVGTYGGGLDEDVAHFTATQATIFDPATDIDATKTATVGEVVETKKKRGRKG